MKKILVINGPNLNFLGIRNHSVYGAEDYEHLLGLINDKAVSLGVDVQVFQSNCEGAIIDCLQKAYRQGVDAIIINPGAYTHYSYAIRDALEIFDVPKVEVHISDIHKREEFRKTSVIEPVCDLQIMGKGLFGYLEALEFAASKNR